MPPQTRKQPAPTVTSQGVGVPTPPVADEIPAPTRPAPDLLEAGNPAGPPEGVDNSQGDVERHDSPSTPAGADTAEGSDLQPPAPDPDVAPVPLRAYGDDLDPVERLRDYLVQNHPTEGTPGEHVADVAIRLLSRLTATGSVATRCTADYCNLAAGHASPHGWVHVDPSVTR